MNTYFFFGPNPSVSRDKLMLDDDGKACSPRPCLHRTDDRLHRDGVVACEGFELYNRGRISVKLCNVQKSGKGRACESLGCYWLVVLVVAMQ